MGARPRVWRRSTDLDQPTGPPPPTQRVLCVSPGTFHRRNYLLSNISMFPPDQASVLTIFLTMVSLFGKCTAPNPKHLVPSFLEPVRSTGSVPRHGAFFVCGHHHACIHAKIIQAKFESRIRNLESSYLSGDYELLLGTGVGTHPTGI